MPTAITYYRYRQWINCQGGGYLEDYNFNPITYSPGTLPPAGLLQVVNWILFLRGQILEGNSKIANGEISIETLPYINPPEGFQIPHAIANTYPIALNDPTTGTAEAIPGVAVDPEQCISYRLNTGSGFSELRTLRSIRATWVNQWAVLYPNLVSQLSQWGAASPANPANAPAWPAGINNPAGYIAYFMLFVLRNTVLIQNKPLPTSVTFFNLLTFIAPSSSGSPMVINPVVSGQLARRKVGEGWPKIHGKAQTFGSHG